MRLQYDATVPSDVRGFHIFLRESSSGENLDIYSAHLSIFRRKIDDILCSTKRIEVIFGMAHAHKSYACNRMRQGNRL